MSKYKVAFKADRDTAGSYALAWEPECPVQITAVQISRNVESSATFLQVKIRNISSECISSIVVELEARLLTGETEQTSLEYLDVDIAAATEITLRPRQLAHANVTACKLTVNIEQTAQRKHGSQRVSQNLSRRIKSCNYPAERSSKEHARSKLKPTTALLKE